MSSQAYSRVGALAVCVVALAVPLSSCGKDDEPSTDVAERLTTTSTTETHPSTTTTSTEAERAAARRAAKRNAARRAAAKRAQLRKQRKQREARLERERQEQAAAATTTPTTVSPEPDPPAAQSKPKPKPPAETGPTVHSISEAATLKLVTKTGISFIQEGTVTGTVDGSMRLDAKLGGKGVEGTFTVTVKDGTLTGRASAALTLNGSFARFRGTATIAKGTGAYADIVPTQLAFTGMVAADASTSNVKLAGDIRY